MKNFTCYYFDDIMRAKILILVIFIIRKSYKNILIYGISNKTFIVAKPLLIDFKKVGGFIKIYDGIKDLELLASERFNTVCHEINYLISE